jgi:hypothetical protein
MPEASTIPATTAENILSGIVATHPQLLAGYSKLGISKERLCKL